MKSAMRWSLVFVFVATFVVACATRQNTDGVFLEEGSDPSSNSPKSTLAEPVSTGDASTTPIDLGFQGGYGDVAITAESAPDTGADTSASD